MFAPNTNLRRAKFRSSSMAEHSAVNRRVVSSSLTCGANLINNLACQRLTGFCCFPRRFTKSHWLTVGVRHRPRLSMTDLYTHQERNEMFLFRKEDAKTDAVELNDSGVSLSKLRHSRNADKVCGFRFAKQGCGNGLNLFTLRFNKGKFADSVVH